MLFFTCGLSSIAGMHPGSRMLLKLRFWTFEFKLVLKIMTATSSEVNHLWEGGVISLLSFSLAISHFIFALQYPPTFYGWDRFSLCLPYLVLLLKGVEYLSCDRRLDTTSSTLLVSTTCTLGHVVVNLLFFHLFYSFEVGGKGLMKLEHIFQT